MTSFHRLSALVLAGTCVLQAAPVSAMGVGLGLSTSSYVDSSDESRTGNSLFARSKASLYAGSKTQGTARTSASIAASSSVVAENSSHGRDKIKADMGLHLGWYKKSGSGMSGTGAAVAQMKLKLERQQSMYENMIKRSIHAVAQVSLRFCKLVGGDGNTVKQCLNNRRDAFKLRVAAMIDAAFNISL